MWRFVGSLFWGTPFWFRFQGRANSQQLSQKSRGQLQVRQLQVFQRTKKYPWKYLENSLNISKCSLGNPSIIPLDCRCASFFPKLRFTLLWDNATAARKLGRLRQSGSAGKGDKWEWFGTERRERRERRWTKWFECWASGLDSLDGLLNWASELQFKRFVLSCSAAQLTVLEASNPTVTWLHLSVSCEVRKFVYVRLCSFIKMSSEMQLTQLTKKIKQVQLASIFNSDASTSTCLLAVCSPLQKGSFPQRSRTSRCCP